MTERWLPAPGFETHYAVSDLGRVRRTDSGRIRKPVPIGAGYLAMNLSVHNRQTMVLVHRLVAIAFHGPAPTTAHEVNHCDGVKANCAASNLEWATASENVRHAHRTGLHPGSTPPKFRGEQHPRAKLTAEAVMAIRISSDSRSVLATRYGVSPSTIKAVRRKNNPNWAWVTGAQESRIA